MGKKMSSRQRRIAAQWMAYYKPLLKQPQRGIITYGGGIDVVAFIDEARAQGFFTTMTAQGVELR